MKILFIASRSIEELGGIENYMANLCPRLVKLGHEVILYTEGNNFSEHYFMGVKIISFRSIQSKFLNKILIALKATFHSLIHYNNFDIFHYNAIPSAFFSIFPIILGKNVIYQGHGLEWQRAKWSGLSQKLIKLSEWFVIKINKNITMVSQDQTDYIKYNFNKSAVTITPAINLPNERKINSTILAKYDLTVDGYFLFLGRLVPEKNPLQLIQAYINSGIKNKKLVIAGHDKNAEEYINKLHLTTQGNKNIIFTGAVYGDDKEMLLKNCFAFCIPSSLEGLPITLLEAMSYGKLCIASDIPACKEALGSSGIYFKVNDVNDLKEKLISLTNDNSKYYHKVNEMSERIENNFTWDIITKKYEDYCNNTLLKQKERI